MGVTLNDFLLGRNVPTNSLEKPTQHVGGGFNIYVLPATAEIEKRLA